MASAAVPSCAAKRLYDSRTEPKTAVGLLRLDAVEEGVPFQQGGVPARSEGPVGRRDDDPEQRAFPLDTEFIIVERRHLLGRR